MARIINVTGRAVSEAKGKPLPAGEYIAQIVDAEEGEYGSSSKNAGRPRLKLQMKILESGTGEGVGRKITDWGLPLFPEWASGSVAFTFINFCKAMGIALPEGDEEFEVEFPDIDELMGQTVGIKVSVENDPQGEPRSRVADYFSPDKPLVVTDATSDNFSLDAAPAKGKGKGKSAEYEL